MRNTTNYSLLLPDEKDFYSVDDMNNNTEIIDAQMKNNQNAINTVATNYNAHAASKNNPHPIILKILSEFIIFFLSEMFFELFASTEELRFNTALAVAKPCGNGNYGFGKEISTEKYFSLRFAEGGKKCVYYSCKLMLF